MDLSYLLNQNLDSAQVDELLGFRIAEIEDVLLKKARLLNPQGNVQTLGHSLHQGNQTWIGLDYQTLQTPYSELKEMMALLAELPRHVVDLGAGYGRMAFVLQSLDPSIEFTGYELVEERVQEGRRILEKFEMKAKLIQQDLMAQDFELPRADVYFLYDFGKVPHIRHIMNKLSILADTHIFKVIARGKGSRSLIDLEYPWLSQVHPALHRENFSIYSLKA